MKRLALLLLASLAVAGCGNTTVVGTPAAAGPPGTSATPTTGPSAADRRDVEIVENGLSTYVLPYSSGPTVSTAVTVRNPNPATWTAYGVGMTLTFRDAAGAVVGTEDRAGTGVIPPGATRAYAFTLDTTGRSLTGTPVRMDVALDRDVRWLTPDDIVAGEITMGRATGRLLKPSGLSPATRMEVTCDGTSTLPVTPAQFALVVLFRDAQGRLTGGDTAYGTIDGGPLPVPPNSGLRFDVLLKEPPLQMPAGVECVAVHAAAER